MKMITPEKLLRSLREGTDEVHVDPELAARGRAAVERMIAIGKPGRWGMTLAKRMRTWSSSAPAWPG